VARAAAKGRKGQRAVAGSAGGRVDAATGKPVAKKNQPPRWEDQLFFNRLRNHTKWVFALLAVIFTLSFVLLGVGSGSSGIGQLLQGNFSGLFGGGSDALAKAKSQVKKHANDPASWQQLATALDTKGQTVAAVAAAKRAVALDPKNASLLGQLAALQSKAYQDAATTYQNAQSASTDTSSNSVFSGSPTVKGVAVLPADPLGQAVATQSGDQVAKLYQAAVGDLTAVIASYKRVAALSPNDPLAQTQLGIQAANLGDRVTALAAFRKALALDPRGVNAATLRQYIAKLLPAAPTPKK
jgi:Flp pilus assembly protein TadD